jgi:hypothetical protein
MSMFTGLKAVNHFGRPDMSSCLKFVQKKHSYVSNYSSATENEACADVNSHCPARDVMIVGPTFFSQSQISVVFFPLWSCELSEEV